MANLQDTAEHQHFERITTGVPGLDDILYGGLIRGGFYLLQGDPGSGKTTFALQFARACVARGEKVLYITITESLKDLHLTFDSHGWSSDGIDIYDMSRVDSVPEHQNTVFSTAEFEMGQTIRAILTELDRVQPQNIVFDGTGELRMLAGDAYTYRRQMLALKRQFDQHNITALMLDDRTNRFGDVQPETVVGGSIFLEKNLPGYGGARRRMHVSKVRGSDFRSGFHDYDIVENEGLVVHPRLIMSRPEERYEREIFTSSIDNLDTMLGGGLQSGTTTLLIGPAGVGKSTIAMQFVVTALQRGYPAAVYTFDEVLDTFFERTEKLCDQDVRRYVELGLLEARQVNPAEMTPGAFAQDVRSVVRDKGARVVVIDSLNGYISAMPEERFLQTHLHELFAYLDELGILSIMVVAQHGVLQTSEGSIDVSYLSDTAMLLRYYEMDGEIRQALNVFKKRTGQHERVVREMSISLDGLHVGEPLRGMQGVLSGLPIPRTQPLTQ